MNALHPTPTRSAKRLRIASLIYVLGAQRRSLIRSNTIGAGLPSPGRTIRCSESSSRPKLRAGLHGIDPVLPNPKLAFQNTRVIAHALDNSNKLPLSVTTQPVCHALSNIAGNWKVTESHVTLAARLRRIRTSLASSDTPRFALQCLVRRTRNAQIRKLRSAAVLAPSLCLDDTDTSG